MEIAKNLEFERVTALCDERFEPRALLSEDEILKPWEQNKLMTEDE